MRAKHSIVPCNANLGFPKIPNRQTDSNKLFCVCAKCNLGRPPLPGDPNKANPETAHFPATPLPSPAHVDRGNSL